MKRSFKTIALYLLLFAAVLIGTVWSAARTESAGARSVMLDSATFPVLFAEWNGRTVNPMRGHAEPMQAAYMHDVITPIPEDRQLRLPLRTYGAQVSGASYQVWSDGLDRLVEEGSARMAVEESGTVLTLPLQNLYETGNVYQLIVTLRADGRDLTYYSRLRCAPGTHDEEMFAFARDFSDRTFSEERAQGLIPYLETSSAADPQTLGNVNIHSTLAQITWGGLAPEKNADEQILLTELNDTYATYVFLYTVTSSDAQAGETSYRVRETYTIRWSDVRCYVMNFARTMEEIWQPGRDSAAATALDLGIRPEGSLSALASDNGQYVYLTEGGRLWCYDKKGAQLVSVFSFLDPEDDGLRTDCGLHDIRPVSVRDDGSCSFLVCGYFPRGPHEGQTGIGVYEYDRDGRELEEVWFLSSALPSDVLRCSLDQFCYAGEDNLLCFLQGDTVCSVDFTAGELSPVVSGAAGAHLVSGANGSLAWTPSADASHVTVLHLSDGSSFTVQAPDGCRVRALGFLGEDAVCGIARDELVPDDPSAPYAFPMHELRIYSKTGEQLSIYDPAGVYVTGAEVVGNRINLTRVIRREDGTWTDAAADTLIRNDPADAAAADPLTSRQDSARRKVWQVTISDSGQIRSFSTSAARRFSYHEENTLAIPQDGRTDPYVYAYAEGRLTSRYTRIAEAVASITAQMGTVTDSAGRTVWTRMPRDAQHEIRFTELPTAASDEEAWAACLQMMILRAGGSGNGRDLLAQYGTPWAALNAGMNGRALDLTGLTVSQLIASPLPQDRPVLTLLPNGHPVLVCGFDAFNVTVYDPQEGRSYKMGQDSALAAFSERGRYFLSTY